MTYQEGNVELVLSIVKQLVINGKLLKDAIKYAAELFPEPLSLLQEVFCTKQSYFDSNKFQIAVQSAFDALKEELLEEYVVQEANIRSLAPSEYQLEARIDYLTQSIASHQAYRHEIENCMGQLQVVLDENPYLEDFQQLEQRAAHIRDILTQSGISQRKEPINEDCVF